MKEKVDLLLLRVSKGLAYKPVDETYTSKSPCILTGIIDAYVESKGFVSKIIDLEVEQLTDKQLTEIISRMSPAWVGVMATGVNVSASTQSMPAVIDVFNNSLKKLECKTFVYGGHPTVLPERTLKETGADLVIVGEGYETIIQLLDHHGDKYEEIDGVAYYLTSAETGQKKFVKNKSRALFDISLLPRINWEKMNPSQYRAHNWHCFGEYIDNRSPYAVIWTSLGCAYPCEFCCVNNLYEKRTFRFRNMVDVVDEIEMLVKDFGVHHLRIYDELFIMRHPRIDEFCELMESRGLKPNIWCYARADSVTPEILKRLKGVGVNWIGYGFEAGENESALKDINKKLRKSWEYTNTQIVEMTRNVGINMIGHAILGLYDDDEDAIRNNLAFLKKHKFEWNNIYPAFAYPGTPFYKRYVEGGIINEPEDWEEYSLYGYNCKPLPTKHLSSSEVLALRDKLVIEYYKDPEVREDFQKKFGAQTMEHLDKMFSVKLPRKLLGD